MYSFLCTPLAINSAHSDKPLEAKAAKVKSQGILPARSTASSAAAKNTLSEKQTPNLSKGIKKRGKL